MTITLESISELLERGFIDAYDDPGQVKASIDAAIRERDRLRGDVSGMTEELLHVPSREEWRALQKRVERAEAELAESRETIKRLNRRAQVAEAGVVEKVREHAGGSLGRALANAAAEMFRRERDEAQAELAALKARILPGAAKVEIADTDDPDGNPYGWVGGTLLSHNLIGKRVRLVVEK